MGPINLNDFGATQQRANNEHSAKEHDATQTRLNNRYGLLLKESSDDFVDLRRMLVVSPTILDRLPIGQPTTKVTSSMPVFSDDADSFEGSILQTMLYEKPDSGYLDEKAGAANNGADVTGYLDSAPEIANNNRLAGSLNVKSPTPWNKFNALLVKYLNKYIAQVKGYEESRERRFELNQAVQQHTPTSGDNYQTRRSPKWQTAISGSSSSSSSIQSASGHNNERRQASPIPVASSESKNLLTFACLAVDGSPMNNLTFDWHFGQTQLPETADIFASPLASNSGSTSATTGNEQPASSSNNNDDHHQSQQQANFRNQHKSPLLVYASENYTVNVVLVRRLDTKTSLNPFKMSLITLDVIVQSNANAAGHIADLDSSRLARRHSIGEEASYLSVARGNEPSNRGQINGLFGGASSSSQPSGGTTTTKYKSLANFDATKPLSRVDSAGDAGLVYIGSEFEPLSFAPTLGQLEESNWLEKINQLLKCSITNQVGTSDFCHAQVNFVERTKSRSGATGAGASLSSSSYSFEFSRWTMPLLGHKSVLIVCILICLAMLVFAISTLLFQPYFLQSLHLKSRDFMTGGHSGSYSSDRHNRQDHTGASGTTNTGVSSRPITGDSSTGQSTSSQKSSMLGLLSNGDSSLHGSSDDDSCARLNNTNNANLEAGGNTTHGLANLANSLSGANGKLARSRNHSQLGKTNSQGGHLSRHPSGGRVSSEYDKPRGISSANVYNQTSDRQLVSVSELYDSQANRHRLADQQQQGYQVRAIDCLDSKTLAASSSSSAATNSSGGGGGGLLANLSFKSLSKFKADKISFKKGSPASTESSTFFGGPSNLRHSIHATSNSSRPNASKLLQPYTSSSRNRTDDDQLLTPPTYSNMANYNSGIDAMEEFIRKREANMNLISGRDQAAFYRSQSIRNQPATMLPLSSQTAMMMHHHDHQQPMYYAQHLVNSSSMSANHHQVHHLPMGHRPASMSGANFYGIPVQNGPPPPPPASRAPPPIATRSQSRPILAANFVSQQYHDSSANGYSVSGYDGSGSSATYNLGVESIPTLSYRTPLDGRVGHLADSLAQHDYTDQYRYQRMAQIGTYGNQLPAIHNMNQSAEHIYDANTYATPEQTPMRPSGTKAQNQVSERLSVSQLIQTFSSSDQNIS